MSTHSEKEMERDGWNAFIPHVTNTLPLIGGFLVARDLTPLEGSAKTRLHLLLPAGQESYMPTFMSPKSIKAAHALFYLIPVQESYT